MYVQNQAALLDTLEQLIGTDGLYEDPNIGLMQNDVYPTKDKVLADFGVAAFNGIAQWTAITWGIPFLNANVQAEVLGQLVNFLTTSAPSEPVTIYGYVISNTGNTDWLLAERFATPFVFNANAQHFSIIPRMVYDT